MFGQTPVGAKHVQSHVSAHMPSHSCRMPALVVLGLNHIFPKLLGAQLALLEHPITSNEVISPCVVEFGPEEHDGNTNPHPQRALGQSPFVQLGPGSMPNRRQIMKEADPEAAVVFLVVAHHIFYCPSAIADEHFCLGIEVRGHSMVRMSRGPSCAVGVKPPDFRLHFLEVVKAMLALAFEVV